MLPLPPHWDPARVGEVWRVDYAAEARALRQYGGGNEPILNRTVHVLRRRIAGSPHMTRRRRVTRRKLHFLFNLTSGVPLSSSSSACLINPTPTRPFGISTHG